MSLRIPLILPLLLSFSTTLFCPHVSARDPKGRFVVMIDPGHGGHDSGAKGARGLEKNINLNVALKVGEHLKSIRPDIIVKYTRKKDEFIGLMERAQMANKAKADLFVSIHTNSAGRKGTSARGSETYVLGLHRTADNLEVAKKENAAILLEDDYSRKYEGFDPNSSESYIMFEFIQNKHLENSLKVAREVQQGMVSVGMPNRGVRQAGFLVIRETSMPSILVELGFISNKKEEQYLMSAKGANELGKSIARGISKYEQVLANRSGIKANGNTQTASRVKAAEASNNANVDFPGAEGLIYRIQVHADKRKLKASDPVFKGYRNGLTYYIEDGLYKYTLYETPDLSEAKRLRKELSPKFKGCFIVSFLEGEKQSAIY